MNNKAFRLLKQLRNKIHGTNIYVCEYYYALKLFISKEWNIFLVIFNVF